MDEHVAVNGVNSDHKLAGCQRQAEFRLHSAERVVSDRVVDFVYVDAQNLGRRQRFDVSPSEHSSELQGSRV